jgi:hypothetical protein
MPIMRNLFRKQDENTRPATSGGERVANGTATKPIDINEKEQPAEYKLSGTIPHPLNVANVHQDQN